LIFSLKLKLINFVPSFAMDIVKRISNPKNPPLIVAELSGNHGGI
jgi:hypothetical protein